MGLLQSPGLFLFRRKYKAYFSNANGFTVFSPIPPPGPVLIIDARMAERDCPAVRKEAWPWSLPRRLATVQCAMTMPLATIMGSGPAKAARLSSREVFKVIVCCPKITL